MVKVHVLKVPNQRDFTLPFSEEPVGLCYNKDRIFLVHDGQLLRSELVLTGKQYTDFRSGKNLPIRKFGFRGEASFDFEKTGPFKIIHPNPSVTTVTDGILLNMVSPPSLEEGSFIYYDNGMKIAWRRYTADEVDDGVGDSERSAIYCAEFRGSRRNRESDYESATSDYGLGWPCFFGVKISKG